MVLKAAVLWLKAALRTNTHYPAASCIYIAMSTTHSHALQPTQRRQAPCQLVATPLHRQALSPRVSRRCYEAYAVGVATAETRTPQVHLLIINNPALACKIIPHPAAHPPARVKWHARDARRYPRLSGGHKSLYGQATAASHCTAKRRLQVIKKCPAPPREMSPNPADNVLSAVQISTPYLHTDGRCYDTNKSPTPHHDHTQTPS